MHDAGLTLVFSTHQFDGIIGEMDAVSVLQSGKDIIHGTPASIFSINESRLPGALKPPFVAELCAVLNEKGWPVPAGIMQLSGVIEMVAEITKRAQA